MRTIRNRPRFHKALIVFAPLSTQPMNRELFTFEEIASALSMRMVTTQTKKAAANSSQRPFQQREVRLLDHLHALGNALVVGSDSVDV